MKRIKYVLFFSLVLAVSASSDIANSVGSGVMQLSPRAMELLEGKQILFVSKEHNMHTTTTIQKPFFKRVKLMKQNLLRDLHLGYLMFQKAPFEPLLECKNGVVRDPELSFDAQSVIFSMRENKDDSYSLYEINIDGTGLKQLTFAQDVSDIDPLYLPDGGIIFSSTRQPKYCMCNRHIMANLYRMNADGSNITQDRSKYIVRRTCFADERWPDPL
jgi:hypothetical protein